MTSSPATACAQDDAQAAEVEVVEDEPTVEVVVEAAAGFDAAAGAPAVDLADELQPLMNLELGIIKRVCQPTAEQKAKIALAAEKRLSEMTDMVVQNDQNAFQREIVAITPSGRQLSEDPIIRIQRDMTDALQDVVDDQQHATYVQEVETRRRFRRETTVAMTVALLAQRLALSENQKEKIASNLTEDWGEAESIFMRMYISNEQYIPQVPEALVVPVLDAPQKRIWSSLNRTRFPLYIAQFTANVWEEDFLE